MRIKASVVLLVLASAMGMERQAMAQLFPNSAARGSSISSKSKTTSTASKSGQSQDNVADPLQGGEWMIQRSRGRGSFIGANARDQAGFIGTDQASTTGPIRSAIENLRTRLNTNVNQALAARRKSEIYGPRLQVAFEVAPVSSEAVSSAVARQLKATLALRALSPLEVSVEGRTATLRGEVASEADRDLARQMTLFEPGIDEVRNLLTVKPASSTPSATQSPR